MFGRRTVALFAFAAIAIPTAAQAEDIAVTAGMVPVSFDGEVEADEASTRFGANCWGHTPDDAQYEITVTGNDPVTTTIVASSEVDTTLVLVGEDTTWCNDDADLTLNPRITAALPPGEYELYVGTYLSDVEAEYTVSVVTVPRGVINAGTAGDTTLGAGFQATALAGISGGTMPANVFGVECIGNLPQMPQHVITTAGPTPAVFDVSSTADTTLVIVSPNAVYCNDDTNGFDPQIVQTLQAGTHYVYVGNYVGTAPAQYALTIRP